MARMRQMALVWAARVAVSLKGSDPQPIGAMPARRVHSRLAGLAVVSGTAVLAGPKDMPNQPCAVALHC